jgi:hypothetical protein
MVKKEYQYRFRYKGLAVLFSPFLISLLVTILLVILFFPSQSKYKVLVDSIQKFKPHLITYDDLNGDNTSDLITITDDIPGRIALVIIEYPSGRVNQWNFEGTLITPTNDYIITGDYDNNHKKEIYILSISHDSIMLQCISDIRNNVPELKNTFIAKVGFRKGKYDPAIVKAEMDDLNDDGYKELIFAVNAGFSLIPRNIFAYDLFNKKCLTSPYLGLTVDQIIQKDITGDGKNEFLIQGHGPDNITDTTIKYHDRSTWLMVLDRKLNFLFKPVEFKGAYSHIFPFVFENDKHLNQPGFFFKKNTSPSISELCLFSKNGKITKTLNLKEIAPDGIYNPFTITDNGKNLLMLPENNKDEMLVVNEQFEVLAKKKIFALESPLVWFDLDKDGLKEMISIDPIQGKLVIVRSSMSHPVYIDLNPGNGGQPVFSLKENGKEMPELVIWDHSALTLLSYQMNPLFYLKWLIYLGIYLSILLFSWFIRRVQRYQIEQKMQIEKKITELQMKIVKNQLDPHFTLNAVNSIIYAVGNNEPQRATEHLYHFSNLYRHLLLTADQYKCSLKEELDFTVNYLKMEQLRFRDKFTYTINEDGVDQTIEVPKMCIQTAVENAVKHGISPVKTGGEIMVKVSQSDSQLLIEVSDNGLGREASAKLKTSSTRKGMQLTQQYFDLFTKITNRKVTSEVIDLKDDAGNSDGTKVCIAIEVN